MNIKSQLLLVITFITCALVAFSISIYVSLRNYSYAVANTGIATQIVSDVFEERLLADDFILYSGERAKKQWFIKHNNLSDVITESKKITINEQERELLNTIEQSANYSERVFRQLVDQEAKTSSVSATLNEQDLRLGRQLSSSAQETISAAKMLYTFYNSTAEQALQQIILIFALAAILFFTMLLGSFWIIWRNTNKLDLEKAKDEAILSSVGSGLVALDLEGKITVVNQAVEHLIGLKQHEIIGKVWSDIVPILDFKGNKVPETLRPIAIVLKEGRTVESNQFSYVRKDSRIVPVSITVSPIISEGKNLGAIEVIRDITHDREVDRMKTEFISLASHQLRTPLSAMKWFLEMLLDGDAGELSPEQKEMVKTVDESNKRMIDLVNSLLNVSRIESGRIIVDPVPTDIGQLIKEVQTDLKAKIEEKQQNFTITISPDLPQVKIDQKLIRQVYMNLLSNAIKYTPKGGTISVSIAIKDDQVLSEIKDNGYGIPAKDHDRVFQKFYRGENIVKVVTEGNGLGMYLVKSLIESSKGKIWFESEEGKGTTFWFTLPLSGMEVKKGEVVLEA